MTGGPLILIGGALAGDNDAVFDTLIGAAKRGPIGVLTTAGDDPRADADEIIALLAAHGARTEWIPVVATEPGSADMLRHAELAESMSGYLLTGGDQMLYIQTLVRPDGGDSRVLAAIRRRVADGAPLAGSSAGMQALAGPNMITGGTSYIALRDGARTGRTSGDSTLTHWPAGGLGFFDSGLLDTHFDAWGRQGRSIRLAADTGHKRVYGIGEDTALVVHRAGPDTLMRVVGSTGVSIVDLRDACIGSVAGRWSISDIRWSYLTNGDGYNPSTWQISRRLARLLDNADQAGTATTPRERPDIFAPYALLDTALDLAGADHVAEVSGVTCETDPQFVVTVRRTPASQAFSDIGAGATSFSDLRLDTHVLDGTAGQHQRRDR